MLNSLITGLIQGQFANHPLMKQVQSMLQGKSKKEHIIGIWNIKKKKRARKPFFNTTIKSKEKNYPICPKFSAI